MNKNIELLLQYLFILFGFIYIHKLKYVKTIDKKIKEHFNIQTKSFFDVFITSIFRISFSSIFWLFLIIIAIFLSHKCNNGFDILGALAGLCCPLCYIPYKLFIQECIKNF